MAASVLVDTGFLIALLSGRDTHHRWAVAAARRHPPPWRTCEAVLSESFHLLGRAGDRQLAALVDRGALQVSFVFADEAPAVLKLLAKYADVPMGFADACLVRMTEAATDALLLTTDSDFRVYRRHSRQAVPCEMPPRR